MSIEFRLEWYDTRSENKFDAHESRRFEWFGSRESIYQLWYTLTHVLGHKHVFIYNLHSVIQTPEKGLAYLIGEEI